MKNIAHINGLSVEVINDRRIVTYLGQECPMISRKENLCEQDTSYFGCVIDSWETYQTPIGVVQRHYYARGAGLETTGVSWGIIPDEQIRKAQAEFLRLSQELAIARKNLEMVTHIVTN